MAALQKGDLTAARKAFETVVRLAPQSPAHYELGLALQRKGGGSGAAEELKKASELDPWLKAPAP
jgi:Tfp pilus assembly protein PilF